MLEGAPRIKRRDLCRLTWGGLLALLVFLGSISGLVGDVAAQDTSRPLAFEVRPSGVVSETPEEALDRRLRQREYLFRSICIQCGRGDRFSSTAPFKPLEALAKTERN
jgi:hypothetical protein